MAVFEVQHQIDEASEQLEAIDAWLTDYNLQLRVGFEVLEFY
jgi:hypothetical protein